MTPKHYHTPPQVGRVKVLCPVCKETVYSRAGIHPQCAVRQSDPPKPKPKPPGAPGVSIDPMLAPDGIIEVEEVV